ncbi:MAG: hypothetical protein AB7D51_02205 [Desulfovibrionaceae bacterium]
MTVNLLSIFLAVFFTLVVILLVFHQRNVELIQSTRFNYALKTQKIHKQIEAAKKSILALHEKIDETRTELQKISER